MSRETPLEKQTRILEERRGSVCRCGTGKEPGYVFCSPCTRFLDKGQRHALNRTGAGYILAYEAAVEIITERKPNKQ